MLALPIATVRAGRPCFASGGKQQRPCHSVRRAPLVMTVAGKQPQQISDDAPAGAGGTVRKVLAAALLSSALLIAGPSTAAGLDTDTVKSGLKATVEASDIAKEKAGDVVQKLKKEVLPDAAAKLRQDADGSGSSYPDSIELRTVASEIEALDRQVKAGANESVVKSAASGIEQQLNALKGILGFD
ncbi:hypothetical protein ABPG75_009339 [Micractinium tetrahymenae]